MQICTHIKSIAQKTPSVKTFVLDYGNQEFTFHPGQWIDLHLTINDETHNCGYSITSIPGSDHTIEVAVKRAPDLKLTEQLHQHSMVGDEIYISNARGEVFLNNKLANSYVFIAGGVGITPLYSMIRYINLIKPDIKIILIYSITSPDEYLFETELKKLQTDNPNFNLVVTVTRMTQHQEKFSGRINVEMLRALKLPAKSEYYLCGPPQMVDDTVGMLNQLQKELDISESNIHYDKWWA